MMKTVLTSLTCCLVLFPPATSAQQGTVRYDRAIQYDYEMPEELNLPEGIMDRVATESVVPMVMHFSAAEWALRPVQEEAPAAAARDTEARRAGLAMRLRMRSLSRSDHEELLETWVSAEGGTLVETREFMTHTFRIRGPRPSFAWRLTGEEGEFLGYRVQKATALRDSTTIEAWFTPEIPVTAGPGPYGGLPGLILVVSVDDGHLVYTATDVSLEPLAAEVLRPPEAGDPVTREEYDAIVEEKMEELEATHRRRGGNRGGNRG